MNDQRPLIAHVVHSFRIGGLENGIVNLINGLSDLPPSQSPNPDPLPTASLERPLSPRESDRVRAGQPLPTHASQQSPLSPRERDRVRTNYRHAIICLTDHDDFFQRIQAPDVQIFDLHKKAGQDPGLYQRAWRLFRRLKPAIVHTRNLATIEMQLPAWLAGVPVRIHGEHGRDASDPDGAVRKYQLLRRGLKPFIHHFIPLSEELEHYLRGPVGVPAERMTRICNGVDVTRFAPDAMATGELPSPFHKPGTIVVGTVARVDAVKDPLGFADAFIRLRERGKPWSEALRLVWLGGGPMLDKLRDKLAAAGHLDAAWLPGPRDDVSELMRAFDIFVLPSLAEGISNTLLEAMATGLPIVATRVGGNPELVEEEGNALLVERGNPDALAQAIARYAANEDMRKAHGHASRERAEHLFSLDGMVSRYGEVYSRLLAGRGAQ
ncbi:MAG: TIGR03088 family PEP-CTERM/XrtA system glycosyltransferase [Gammaproteobacteria bacterium]|nr:TIGR03088 family PEP-CTERM/XrtA system glycosyltransferase [Gammaproteobacteria bacterium]